MKLLLLIPLLFSVALFSACTSGNEQQAATGANGPGGATGIEASAAGQEALATVEEFITKTNGGGQEVRALASGIYQSSPERYKIVTVACVVLPDLGPTTVTALFSEVQVFTDQEGQPSFYITRYPEQIIPGEGPAAPLSSAERYKIDPVESRLFAQVDRECQPEIKAPVGAES